MRFKVGDLVLDASGVQGTVTHATPGIDRPYRVLAEDGRTAMYADDSTLTELHFGCPGCDDREGCDCRWKGVL